MAGSHVVAKLPLSSPLPLAQDEFVEKADND
jgi:hypothetical protein